jgi:hypothetical protein
LPPVSISLIFRSLPLRVILKRAAQKKLVKLGNFSHLLPSSAKLEDLSVFFIIMLSCHFSKQVTSFFGLKRNLKTFDSFGDEEQVLQVTAGADLLSMLILSTRGGLDGYSPK